MNFNSNREYYNKYWNSKTDTFKDLKLLIENNILINPLIEMCEICNYKIAKYLVEKGVDIHENDEEPLKTAINTGNLKLVKYLVKNEANIYKVVEKNDKRLSYPILGKTHQIRSIQSFQKTTQYIFGLIKTQENAVRIIQNGCYNWLHKYLCKDGTIGIISRLNAEKIMCNGSGTIQRQLISKKKEPVFMVYSIINTK